MTRVVLLIAILFLPLGAVAEVRDDRAALVSAIEHIAERARQLERIPGISIAVAEGDELIVARGYGLADVELEVPATAETVYRIGSITKQFTAAAILQLCDEGKLALDDSVTKYLPELSAPLSGQGHQVNLHHLLSHTAGLAGFRTLGPDMLVRARQDLTPKEIIAIFRDEPLEFAPGERFRYSNAGYFLLGACIEVVSGKSYADYLQEKIFDPLEMTATRYGASDAIIKNRAEGYRLVDGELKNDAFMSMTWPYSAGSLVSTVVDLVQWQRALVNGRVMSDESWKRMTTPIKTADGRPQPYGYGLRLEKIEGRPAITHRGVTNGFSGNLSYLPDEDLTIVVLSNLEGWDVDRVARQLAARVLRK